MSAKQFAFFLAIIVVLLFVGLPLARYVDPKVSSFGGSLHLMIHDPTHQIDLSPSFLWMVCFLGSLRRPRGAGVQRMPFFLVGLFGSASIALYPMWHPDVTQVGLWRILNAGGVGFSFIAIGLYDHITLVRALPKRASEHDDE
jgi:hypothetical protein